MWGSGEIVGGQVKEQGGSWEITAITEARNHRGLDPRPGGLDDVGICFKVGTTEFSDI